MNEPEPVTEGEDADGLRKLGLFALHRRRSEASRRIKQITRAIAAAAGLAPRRREGRPVWMPAVPVKASVESHALVCLFDGRKVTDLESHLKECHSVTPDDYRRHFLLAPDYPMQAPRGSKTTGQPREGREPARHEPSIRKAVTEKKKTRKRIVDTVAANQALEGIDRMEAVMKVLAESGVPLSSRELAERVMREAGREAGTQLMMDVTAKLTVTLNNLFVHGKLDKGGDSYRREWSIRKS